MFIILLKFIDSLQSNFIDQVSIVEAWLVVEQTA